MLGSYRILAFVLAGGRGERLSPLTLERTKPSVPFGGKYRIIDFCLSNIVNSGIYSIYVLVQYKSQSLIEHLRTTWIKGGVLPGHFITVVPPQMRREDVKDWYRGTADSVYQNINLIYDFKPDVVVIFSADHIYRMDIKDMLDYHITKDGDLTISALPLKGKDAKGFGILYVDEESRVINFQEKPKGLEEDKDFLISMGNYIFDTEILLEVLEKDAKNPKSTHDFGKDIIPMMVENNKKLFVYDFSKNRIPGLKEYEAPYYWRDVGTILNFWLSNQDILGEKPILDLDNPYWPIYACNTNVSPSYIMNSQINNSLICEGCKINSAFIQNSILGRGVIVESNSVIKDSIVMDYTVIMDNVHINRAIIDRYNCIERGTKIGVDLTIDKEKFFVDSSGIVVVKRGQRRLSKC